MKTRLVEGYATIINRDSSCVGNMSWETPYIELTIHGETFRYQSEFLDWKYRDLDIGDEVWVKIRVKDNGNVWRFSTPSLMDVVKDYNRS